MKDCVEGDYYSELNLEEVEKDYLTDEHSDDDSDEDIIIWCIITINICFNVLIFLQV